MDGEPGIGKSWLLRDATDEAAELGFSLATGAADQLAQAIPFCPLRTALREPFAGLAARSSRLDRVVDRRDTSAPGAAGRESASPGCLDDLHWASPATLAVLRALPRDLNRQPVAWLLARSTTPQGPADYLFGRLEQDGAARVTLAPLDQDAVTAMLAGAFGAPPDEALARLAAALPGIPRCWPS